MAEGAPGVRVRRARELAGLSQAELARRSGVSRAQVSSIEQDRHTPAVDAALRLARALGVSAESLFEPVERIAVAPALDGRLTGATVVRSTTVGERVVAVPLPLDEGPSGWAAADGIVEHGSLTLFPGGSVAGALILGCDPALRAAEALSEGRGSSRVLAALATTGQALAALRAGRCHAALVHGRATRMPKPPREVARWHLARWQVGLAYHPSLGHSSVEALLAGRVPLIRRHPSAASDQALVRSARRLGVAAPAGPRAQGHLDSARRAAAEPAAAVTYEPAAELYGLGFEPLETHAVELWVADEWSAHPGITQFLEVIGSRAFRARVGARGGYDLAGSGDRCAA